MRIKIYTVLLISLIGITSCVDLNQEPKSFITEEEYIQIPQTIEMLNKAVDGMYNDMWFANYGFNCRLMRVNTGADDMLTAPKPNNSLVYLIELNPSPSANLMDSRQLWRNFWKVITSSNKIINGTPIPEDPVKAQPYIQSVAEAYFMRALSYFHLVRLFGEVPIIRNGDEAIEPQARKPVEMVYNEIIIPDLLKAGSQLPSVSRSGFSSTPSKWAAKACLADAYMNMAGWPLKKGKEYYQKAADVTAEIIDNSGLFLTPDYGDLWKEAKKQDANEHMFAIHNSVLYKNASQYGKSFYPRDYKTNGGWADYYANPDFMNKFPDDDRKSFSYMTAWPTNSKPLVQWQDSQDKLPCISKYQDYNQGPAGKSQLSNGLTPQYRYADVLLMHAEASNLASGTVSAKALKCIQDVQNRSHSPLTVTTDTKAFDDAVFAERGWEFLAEYKRWYDLVRREKLADVKPDLWNKSVYKANNHYYLPLPIEEIEMTGWENNPGY